MVKYLSSGGRLFRVLQMNFLKWWRLDASLANINELHRLELLWFGSITCNFETHGVGPKIFSVNYFSNGNKVKGKLFEEIMLEMTP